MIRYKLLSNQLESAREELKLSNQIILSAAKKVESLFAEHLDAQGIPPAEKERPPLIEHPQPSAPIKAEPTKLIKQAFRKIAMKVHPDKLVHLEGSEEIREKNRLFQKAQKAQENGDLIILLDIMSNLEIGQLKISEIDLVNTENKIRSIKQEIENIHSTLVWKWNMSYDKEEKKAALEQLFGALYERHKNKNSGA